MKDSLFEPKKILQYRNKSGWYAFLYFLILALFMTIGYIAFYIGYDGNSVITSDTTGCELSSTGVECLSSDFDFQTEYNLYGISIYFLNETDQFQDIVFIGDSSLVFQGNSVTLFSSSTQRITFPNLTTLSQSNTFDQFFSTFKTALLVTSILVGFLTNLILLLFVSLVSTIPFLRLKKFIRFKKLYILVIFAITPIAILMTFYNIIPINNVLFFVLMIIGYRSLYILQRELFTTTFLHLQNQQQEQDDNIIDSSYTVTDVEEEETEDNLDVTEDSKDEKD